MFVASRMACLNERMWVIWLPMWKCRSSRQSSISSSRSTSTSCTISRVVRPNFDRSPTESCQRPEERKESLQRTPIRGRISRWRVALMMVCSSVNFSTTMIGVIPSLEDSIAVSTYSASLYPLQIIRACSPASSAMPAMSSGLLPTSSPIPKRRPSLMRVSTTARSWFTLMGKTPRYGASYLNSSRAFWKAALRSRTRARRSPSKRSSRGVATPRRRIWATSS